MALEQTHMLSIQNHAEVDATLYVTVGDGLERLVQTLAAGDAVALPSAANAIWRVELSTLIDAQGGTTLSVVAEGDSDGSHVSMDPGRWEFTLSASLEPTASSDTYYVLHEAHVRKVSGDLDWGTIVEQN